MLNLTSSAVTYRGKSGRLRSGGRVIADLAAWTAEPSGESGLRVRAGECERDAFWWEHRDAARLVLDLDYGRAGLRGPAAIESDDPLVVVVELE